MLIKDAIMNKRKKIVKQNKGGIQMILEFIFLLPFLLIIALLAFDIMKFYFTYNAAQLAAYHASYNFSMTTNVQSSMDSAKKLLTMVGINESRFQDNDVIKASLYQYNTETRSFGTHYPINSSKTAVGCYGEMVSLTCGSYDNQRMRDREVWGVHFEVQNRLLSTIPLENMSGGNLSPVSVPVKAYNHVFEIQRYENDLNP